MTVKELDTKLKEMRVPEYYYSLLIGGTPNERLCLVNEGNKWQVYYSERGEKNGLKEFMSEDEACEHMLKKLKKYSTI